MADSDDDLVYNGRRLKFSKTQVLDAIAGSFGIKLVVCKVLKCNRETFDRYCKRFKYVQEALDRERDRADDFVESRLMDMIASGNVAATIFYAKTRMRNRGYGEHIQLEPVKPEDRPRIIDDVPDNEPAEVVQVSAAEPEDANE